MFLSILLVSCISGGQNWPIPQIGPDEAYASAVFVLKSVGAKYELGKKSIRLERDSVSNMDPKTGKTLRPDRKIIRYRINFHNSGLDRPMSAEVDAISGDVVSIWTVLRPGDVSPQNSKQLSERWLRAIGRSKEFVFQPGSNDFVFLQHGRPILLDPNKCIAVARATNGQFHSLQICGQPPEVFDSQVTVASDEAEAICAKEESKSKWPSPRFYAAEIGYVYDFKDDVLRLLWEVAVEDEFAGKRRVMKHVYVDPYSGRIRNQWDFDQTDMRYRPRAARIGLKPIPKRLLILQPYELAKRKLREFGQPNWTVTELDFADGVRIVGKTYDQRNTSIVLAANGRLLELVGDGPPPTLTDAEALSLGKKIIRENAGRLPEGRFQVVKSMYGNFKEVDYVQTAHGYDCLPGPVASAHFAGAKSLARYHFFKVMPRPLPPMGTIMAAFRIEQIAKAMAEPYLPANTSRVTYSVSTRVKRIGWIVPKGSSDPKLCYEVMIGQNMHTSMGTKGGGSFYLFDAFTGKCYDPYPHH